MNTSSDKQLNIGKRINYLVLMITLVLYSPLQSVVPIISEANAAEESEENMSVTELEQTKFATADEAVDSLIAALGKDDLDTLLDIFGREYEEELIVGDRRDSRDAIKQAY